MQVNSLKPFFIYHWFACSAFSFFMPGLRLTIFYPSLCTSKYSKYYDFQRHGAFHLFILRW